MPHEWISSIVFLKMYSFIISSLNRVDHVTLMALVSVIC